MTAALVWGMVALGIVVVVARRRSVALCAVTIQALLLAGYALSHASEGAAALALGVRGVALAVVFGLLVARTREVRRVAPGIPPLRRLAGSSALALALVWLVPPIGLTSLAAQHCVLTLIAFGLVIAATRRETLFQVLGIVLIENGLAMTALTLPGVPSPTIELGVAVDVMLLAIVASVFHDRIFAEFGGGDTARLRSLRD